MRRLLARRRRPLIGLGLLLGATAALAAPPEASPPVSRGVGERSAGVVRPRSEATVAVPRPGVLAEVLVSEGDGVVRNQVLARLDDRVARATVEVARLHAERSGPLDEARHELARAESDLARVERLHELQSASEHELSAARTAARRAKAAVRAAEEAMTIARAELRLQEQRLEAHLIRAPFDGRVVRIHGQAGEAAQTGDPLLTLLAMDALETDLHLPLNLYGHLQVGRDYDLTAGPPVDGVLSGRLELVDPRLDGESGTFRCRFRLDNADERLPCGFRVELAPSALSAAR